MSSTAFNFRPEIGPICPVAVCVSPDNPQLNIYNGLFDTGASFTCISDMVVEKERLVERGKTMMTGATGAREVGVFPVFLGFPMNIRHAEDGNFRAVTHWFDDVRASNFHKGEDCPFDILIGRDVICRGVLNLSFDGHCVFSF